MRGFRGTARSVKNNMRGTALGSAAGCAGRQGVCGTAGMSGVLTARLTEIGRRAVWHYLDGQT